MHVYYKNSLFLYENINPDAGTPVFVFHRATVFTFGKPASKKTLQKIMKEYYAKIDKYAEWFTPKEVEAWEARQVEPDASKGLGFNWVELSSGSRWKDTLVPESRDAVFQLQAYEHDIRLGPAEFLAEARNYGPNQHVRKALGLVVKSFWEWLTR